MISVVLNVSVQFGSSITEMSAKFKSNLIVIYIFSFFLILKRCYENKFNQIVCPY